MPNGWLGEWFVEPDDGGEPLPIPRDSIVSTDRVGVVEGVEVTFDVVPGEHGFEAQNVRVPRWAWSAMGDEAAGV